MTILSYVSQITNGGILFVSILSVLTCLGVILNRNAIVSIMYLILLYVEVSFYFYLTGLGIFGLLYILVYVGAIAILFLFILSLMNMKISELSLTNNKQDYLLISIGVLFLVGSMLYIYSDQYSLNALYNNVQYMFGGLFGTDSIELTYLTQNVSEVNNLLITDWSNIDSISELKMIGELLYTQYAFLFVVIALTLLLSIIGAIAIIMR